MRAVTISLMLVGPPKARIVCDCGQWFRAHIDVEFFSCPRPGCHASESATITLAQFVLETFPSETQQLLNVAVPNGMKGPDPCESAPSTFH